MGRPNPVRLDQVARLEPVVQNAVQEAGQALELHAHVLVLLRAREPLMAYTGRGDSITGTQHSPSELARFEFCSNGGHDHDELSLLLLTHAHVNKPNASKRIDVGDVHSESTKKQRKRK